MLDFNVLPTATPARVVANPAVRGAVPANDPEAVVAFGSLIDVLSGAGEGEPAETNADSMLVAALEAEDVAAESEGDAAATVPGAAVAYTIPVLANVPAPDTSGLEAEPAGVLVDDSTRQLNSPASSLDGDLNSLDGGGASPQPSGESAVVSAAGMPQPVAGSPVAAEKATSPEQTAEQTAAPLRTRPLAPEGRTTPMAGRVEAPVSGEAPVVESAARKMSAGPAVERQTKAAPTIDPAGLAVERRASAATATEPANGATSIEVIEVAEAEVEDASRAPSDRSARPGATVSDAAADRARMALAAAASRATRQPAAEPARRVVPAIDAPNVARTQTDQSSLALNVGRASGLAHADGFVSGLMRSASRSEADSSDLMRHFSAPQPSVMARPAAPSSGVGAMTLPVADEASPAQVAAQVVQSIQLLVTRGGGEAHLRLEPAYLGQLTVTLKLDRSGVSATIQAETPVVRESLQTNETLLRQALAEHGLRLDRLDVTEPAREESLQEERDRPDEQPRERRPRRDRDERDGTARFEVVA